MWIRGSREQLEALIFAEPGRLLAFRRGGWLSVLRLGAVARSTSRAGFGCVLVAFGFFRSWLARSLLFQNHRGRSRFHLKHLHAGWLWLRFLFQLSAISRQLSARF